jgi:hypothetical protein
MAQGDVKASRRASAASKFKRKEKQSNYRRKEAKNETP